MSSRKAREEQLARLKAARAGGGKRVDQYKASLAQPVLST
jgi:hypothetical protein